MSQLMGNLIGVRVTLIWSIKGAKG